MPYPNFKKKPDYSGLIDKKQAQVDFHLLFCMYFQSILHKYLVNRIK